MKKTYFITTLLLLAGIISASTINKPASSQPAYPKAKSATGGMYGFIENKGQIIDQNNQLNPAVLYLYNGNGLHVQLKQNGFSYEVIKINSPSNSPQRGDFKSLPLVNDKGNFPPSGVRGLDSIFIHRIDISFVGANQNVKMTSSDAAPDYINYYTTGTPEEG
ncbi:MAG: hypothetical protein ACHQK8_07600, partial [Bacteroidia bacterium]